MNDDCSLSAAECCAERFCACVLSQVPALSRSVLRVAADPRLAPDSGSFETEDGRHRWLASPLAMGDPCMMAMLLKLEFDLPMRLARYTAQTEQPAFPMERLSAVARRTVSWFQHPQFAEALAQTWRRAARSPQPMSYHVACDPDGYAYAVSIRHIPAQGGKRRSVAAELLVAERLHACWCKEALQEEAGELCPRFRPGTEGLFYRPCILEGLE